MKNIFLIHSVNGNTIDSFAPSMEKFCKENNLDYYYPIFPIRAEASPESWGKILNEYVENGTLNQESMVITHSIGTKFIPKFLVKNNLRIDTFISVAGFVDYVGRTDYLKDVNDIFRISDDEFNIAQNLIKKRYSIYSDNDDNSPLEKCEKYADKLNANKVFIKGAGHFTSKDGIFKINELNKILEEYSNSKHNIIVTSAGFNDINNFVAEENIRKFEEISKGKNVMIIANAAPKGTGNYIARVNVQENFIKIGALRCDIIDIDDTNMESILNYDVVYVLGGNTTYLLSLSNNMKFVKIMNKFLEHGIYIGESAGSIVLGNDAKYYYEIKKGTKAKYDVVLDSYKGLGYTDINIYPHFNKADDEMREKISQYEKNNNIKIIRLNDGDIVYY